MTLQVSLSAEADADIATIYNWYEKAQTGLAHEFIEPLSAQLRAAVANPTPGVVQGSRNNSPRTTTAARFALAPGERPKLVRRTETSVARPKMGRDAHRPT